MELTFEKSCILPPAPASGIVGGGGVGMGVGGGGTYSVPGARAAWGERGRNPTARNRWDGTHS